MSAKTTKVRDKSHKALKIVSNGKSPGPINNSDILMEEHTKVRNLLLC